MADSDISRKIHLKGYRENELPLVILFARSYFILPMSQNRHSSHLSVIFILPMSQNRHSSHHANRELTLYILYYITYFLK